MQGTHLKFDTKEAAIQFCEKQGYEFFIQEPRKAAFKPKNYAVYALLLSLFLLLERDELMRDGWDETATTSTRLSPFVSLTPSRSSVVPVDDSRVGVQRNEVLHFLFCSPTFGPALRRREVLRSGELGIARGRQE